MFKDTFLTVHLQMAATEIRRVSLLQIFFVSLDKPVLLHRRCLVLKFSKVSDTGVQKNILCRKRFSAFYPTLHETVSNSWVSILYKNLIFSLLT